MFSKLRQNFRMANVLCRVLFILTYVFASWQRFLQASYLVTTEANLPLSLLAAAIMGVIMQFIVPALVNVFINLSKIHSLPVAEYCVVVFLFLSAGMLLCGAINLFAWFFPVAAVWITSLSPIVVTLGVGFAFFKVTAKLYFNDVTTVTYAKACVVAVAVLLVVLGVLL